LFLRNFGETCKAIIALQVSLKLIGVLFLFNVQPYISMRYLFLLISLITSPLLGQELQDTWSKMISNPYSEYASEMAIDHGGNIWALAYSNGSIGNLAYKGKDEVYLTKMDSDGNQLWELSFGSKEDDLAYNLAIDAQNNCWVSGFFSDTLWVGDSTLVSNGGTDAFLLKFDPNGSLQVAKQLGASGYDRAHHIAVQGNAVYWLGVYQGTVEIDIDTLTEIAINDVFLLKMDTLGQNIWIKQWGCPSIENISGLTVDNQGNITAATLFRDALIIESDTLWGLPTINNFLVQFNTNGDLLWKTSFEGSGRGLTHDDSNNIYYTGSFSDSVNILNQQLHSLGESDGFLLSLDNNGQVRWLEPIQGFDQISATNVLWNSQRQERYVTGLLQGTLFYGNDSIESAASGSRHTDDDLYVLAFDFNGLALYAQKFGGQYEDWLANLALHPTDGSLYMFGSFDGDIDFVNTSLQNDGNKDLFIAKFNIQTVAIKKLENNIISSINLFPNPTQEAVVVSFKLQDHSTISIDILNWNGQLVQSNSYDNCSAGEYKKTIHLPKTLSSGIYLVVVQSSSSRQTTKLMVRR
jgi:hypothetical protein